MVERSEAEHDRLRQLAGCKHWLQLYQPLADVTTVALGSGSEREDYPCIYVEKLEGWKELQAVIDAAHGCGGPDVQYPSAADLERDLHTIKVIVHGCMRALKEAFSAGVHFDPTGRQGPMVSDVMYLERDGKVKLLDVETLEDNTPDTVRRLLAPTLLPSP